MRDGALKGVDQLGDGGEDRAVVVGQLAGADSVSRRLMVFSRASKDPLFSESRCPARIRQKQPDRNERKGEPGGY
jgi:hypothetical protein